MPPATLIIFDFSGTLSHEAPQFAAPESLMRELTASGLAAFGVDSPRTFWEELVNPTWIEGSTTAAGYKKVLQDRIIAALHPDLPPDGRVRLAAAVAAFADRYFSHSRIDARWAPFLTQLQDDPSVMAVIATDHYAEATDCLLKFLGEWQIRAAAFRGAIPIPRPPSFIVANSADLGVHKSDPAFWQILKKGLYLSPIHHILLIDDFGGNEQAQDGYSDPRKVDARMRQTVRTLESVFCASVVLIPVMAGTGPDHGDERWERAIREAVSAANRHLAAGHRRTTGDLK